MEPAAARVALGLTSRFRRIRGGQRPIPGSETLPNLYSSNQPGAKTVIPQVDTAPTGVETPTQGVHMW